MYTEVIQRAWGFCTLYACALYNTFKAQGRRKRGVGGLQPPQFLAEQFTLSQPGGRLYPTQYYEPPRIFRPCDGPVASYTSTVTLLHNYGQNVHGLLKRYQTYVTHKSFKNPIQMHKMFTQTLVLMIFKQTIDLYKRINSYFTYIFIMKKVLQFLVQTWKF